MGLEVDQMFGFGFGAETGNNRSFGVVSFSVQKTQVCFGYGRNYTRFRSFLAETRQMSKSLFLLFLHAQDESGSVWLYARTVQLCLGFRPLHGALPS